MSDDPNEKMVELEIRIDALEKDKKNQFMAGIIAGVMIVAIIALGGACGWNIYRNYQKATEKKRQALEVKADVIEGYIKKLDKIYTQEPKPLPKHDEKGPE